VELRDLLHKGSLLFERSSESSIRWVKQPPPHISKCTQCRQLLSSIAVWKLRINLNIRESFQISRKLDFRILVSSSVSIILLRLTQGKKKPSGRKIALSIPAEHFDRLSILKQLNGEPNLNVNSDKFEILFILRPPPLRNKPENAQLADAELFCQVAGLREGFIIREYRNKM